MKSTDCYSHPDHPNRHFRVSSERDGLCTIVASNGTKLYGIKRDALRLCGCRWTWTPKLKAKSR